MLSNPYRSINGRTYVTVQQLAFDLKLEAQSINDVIRKRGGAPYYQDGPKALCYVEIRLYDIAREIIASLIRDGFVMPDIRHGVRRPRTDKKFMSEFRKRLIARTDVWPDELKSLRPPMERRGKRKEPYFGPVPWPEDKDLLSDEKVPQTKVDDKLEAQKKFARVVAFELYAIMRKDYFDFTDAVVKKVRAGLRDEVEMISKKVIVDLFKNVVEH